MQRCAGLELFTRAQQLFLSGCSLLGSLGLSLLQQCHLFPLHHPGFKVCCLDATCSFVFFVISHQSQQVFPLILLSLFPHSSSCSAGHFFFFNISRHCSAHFSSNFYFYWQVIALHCYGGLCHTSVRISHDYMYVLPSFFGLSPPPLSPSLRCYRSGRRRCLCSHSSFTLVTYFTRDECVYTRQCCSLRMSHSLLPLASRPQVHSLSGNDS